MALADGCFYHPTRTRYDAPENYNLRYESVWFPSSQATRLHGWFFPARGSARGTVVHCHGNAGNVTGHFPFVSWLPARDWNVLCFDYRGYGCSTGRVTRTGTIDDVHAAVDYVRTRADVDCDRLVLFGQSLGGTVALTAASQRRDLRGVAVEGAFSGYRAEARDVLKRTLILYGVAGLAARYLISDDHAPIRTIAEIAPCPILFICGTDDTIVDYRQTVALYEAAGDPKELWLIDGVEHCAAMLSEDHDRRSHLVRFFADCVSPDSSSA
jgi:fermentation-respiration switch protein FrsA (DUF1100 family)